MTFYDYLEDYYVNNDGSMVLDDDLSDAFNAWLANLSVDKWLTHGDYYHNNNK